MSRDDAAQLRRFRVQAEEHGARVLEGMAALQRCGERDVERFGAWLVFDARVAFAYAGLVVDGQAVRR